MLYQIKSFFIKITVTFTPPLTLLLYATALLTGLVVSAVHC